MSNRRSERLRKQKRVLSRGSLSSITMMMRMMKTRTEMTSMTKLKSTVGREVDLLESLLEESTH
jgi:hypothetical protein